MIDLDFDKVGGLLPAIVQDAESEAVLMLGFMDQEALQTTLRTGRATFVRRGRMSLWTTFAHIVSINVDRNRDSVLLRVLRSDCESIEHQGFSDAINWPRIAGDEALRSGADSTRSTGRCSGYAFHC